MGKPDYTKVRSVYTPDSDLTELILNIDSPEDNQWGYAFYEDEVPDYMIAHAKRNKEAKQLKPSLKLSRMVENHLNPDADKNWRRETD